MFYVNSQKDSLRQILKPHMVLQTLVKREVHYGVLQIAARWPTGIIGDFPDHATFRKTGVNTGLVRQTWGFLFFDPL